MYIYIYIYIYYYILSLRCSRRESPIKVLQHLYKMTLKCSASKIINYLMLYMLK